MRIGQGIDYTGEGTRKRYDYQGENLYVIISDDDDDGNPHAVQFSLSGETVNNKTDMLSNLDALAEMVTVALRNEDVDYVVSKLARASRGPNTAAGILVDALWGYK